MKQTQASGEMDRDEKIKRMLKLMLESIMEGERTAFLGYEKYDTKPASNNGNSRNGYYQRDLLTGLGNLVNLSVPRDRFDEFDTELLDQWEQSIKPMDQLILKLYAKGMSTRDINDVVQQIYGKAMSPQSVTLITQEIESERIAWERRILDTRYTVLFIDALHTKIRRDVVSTDAVYTVAGIDHEGYRDILGQYVGAAESATFWKAVLADLKSRGVQEVLLFVFDGLTGLTQVVQEVFPHALTQLCVVHQVRNTLSQVRKHHRDQIASDLKTIYTQSTKQEAKSQALAVQAKWKHSYPRLMQSWIDKIDQLTTFLEFPSYLRPHLYTTNWIERLNKEFRKLLKTKNALPTEGSVRNLLYFKVKDITRKLESSRLNGFVQHHIDLQILWEKQYGSVSAGKEVFTQSS